MTPGRVLGAAAVVVVVTGVLGETLGVDPDSAGGVASGIVVLAGAAVGLGALVWLPFDVLRHRRARRDARFAALDEQPAPDAPDVPVVWVVEEVDPGPEPLVQLRELDGPRTLVARVDRTDLHDEAPPVGTEVIIVAHDQDGSFEFVNAATYYDHDVRPEDDWIVLAHPVDAGDTPAAADASTALPVWPDA